MQQMHHALPTGRTLVEAKRHIQKISTLRSQTSDVYGTDRNSKQRLTCFEKRLSIMSIFVISTSLKSAVFCRGIPWLTCFPGVMAAIIPIPWKVPFLSNVITLWSTLSPANNKEWPRMSMSPPNTSGVSEHATFISNLCISGDDEANPMVERLSIKNRDLYKWCICTVTPSYRGAITALGRTAWTTACQMPATFLDVSFPTNRCCNKNHKLAGIKSNAAASFSSAVVKYVSSIGARVVLKSILMCATLQSGTKKQNILLLSPRGPRFNSKCTSYNQGSMPKLQHFFGPLCRSGWGKG